MITASMVNRDGAPWLFICDNATYPKGVRKHQLSLTIPEAEQVIADLRKAFDEEGENR